MKKMLFLSTFCSIFLLSSFTYKTDSEKQPRTIIRTSSILNGKNVEKTIIVLDGTTSREELIHTCNYLAKENVQLTFDKLTIGKSFLGLIGKQRIRVAEGKIKLADGSTQNFKAGGATSFKSLKIQYSNTNASKSQSIDMIEIID